MFQLLTIQGFVIIMHSKQYIRKLKTPDYRLNIIRWCYPRIKMNIKLVKLKKKSKYLLIYWNNNATFNHRRIIL